MADPSDDQPSAEQDGGEPRDSKPETPHRPANTLLGHRALDGSSPLIPAATPSPRPAGVAPRLRPPRVGQWASPTKSSAGTPAVTIPGGTPGTAPGSTAPGNTTPGNTTPGNTTPGNTTPGNTTPGGATPSIGKPIRTPPPFPAVPFSSQRTSPTPVQAPAKASTILYGQSAKTATPPEADDEAWENAEEAEASAELEEVPELEDAESIEAEPDDAEDEGRTTDVREQTAAATPAPSRASVDPTRVSQRPQKASLSPGSYSVSSEGQSVAPASSKEEASPLEREIVGRAERLSADDPVGAARAFVEAGLLSEWILADRDQARARYDSARSLVRGLQPALARLRRFASAQTAMSGSSGAVNEVLSVIDDELAVAETDGARADLHASKGRVFETLGRLEGARGAYTQALKFDAQHPASLRGLESVLRRQLDDAKPPQADLAALLLRLSEIFAPDGSDGDAGLAAWLCVERAELLDRKLAQSEPAKEALLRGVTLLPGPGPVRAALVRHLSKYDRDAGLCEALRVEAERETDADRAARLLYTSARISLDRMGSRGDGVSTLARADQRAVSGTPVQERIISELINQLEIDSDHGRLVEVRIKRLGLLRQPGPVAYEYLRLADAYGRIGRADLAVDAATRALSQTPGNHSARDTLDQALQRLGRHNERTTVWLREANSEASSLIRLRAYLKAAEIFHRNLNRKEQAVDALRAAWLLSPGHGETFDLLSALLAAPARSDEAALKNAEDRAELFEQAADRETDRERKLALYEKVLGIYEDELARPDRGVEIAEKMLAIDPKRRFAIIALERNARRAGLPDKLTKALLDEAAATPDASLKVRLFLEAAQVAERAGDRERALSLVSRALEAKPNDPTAERQRATLLKYLSRFDDARKSLVLLAEHEKETAFETWLEIAELDEGFRKAPTDAVDAFRAAQKLRSDHPLPMLSMVRLLRTTKSFKRLVSELKQLAKSDLDTRQLLLFEVMAAEVEEHNLGDDEAALRSLTAAETAARNAEMFDPAIYESMERILVRLGDDEGLIRLYARWLERQPPAAVDHALRIALATTLEKTSPGQAVEVLDALVGVVPSHLPALRRLEHLHRARKSYQPLSQALYAQASILTSRVARAGALWEIVSLEERLGASVTLDALARISREYPNDTGALDSIIRIASRLVSNVAVPHPALIAARTQLLGAIRVRRELCVDPVSRGAYLLEEAMLLERQEVDPDIGAAFAAYREALGLWPDSSLAARGVERLAESMGDFQSLVTAHQALAKLTDSAADRSSHLCAAARATLDQLRDERTAIELFEVSLDADAANQVASKALVKLLANDPKRLLESLRPALDLVSAKDAVLYLGTEVGNAYLRLSQQEGDAARIDYSPGIAAVRKVLTSVADDVGALFLIARLYQSQGAWAEAKDSLKRVVEVAGSTDGKTRQRALFALVDLYEGPMADLKLAETTLVSVLSSEPSNKQALERLFAIATKSGDQKLARSSLERLAEYETDLSQRAEYQLRVAEVCRESNDGAGMLKALLDAIVSLPSDLRAWNLLARLYRAETQEGAAGLVAAIEQVMEMTKARRRPVETRWLLTLGLLQVNMLKRHTDGLANLQTAAQTASAAHGPEVRAALGSGLLAAGRTKEAITVLRELLTKDSETLLRLSENAVFNTIRTACVAATGSVLGAVLSCLDSALATEGRVEERLSVEETRAALGEILGDRVTKLRNRRLEPEIPYANALASSELVHVMVNEARSSLVEVASAIQPIAAKVLRFELSALGVGSRERIGARDGHPTRHFADKIARCLGIESFELYLTSSWNGAIRVYPGETPALVGPAMLADLPETEQMFALGRLLSRVALGPTWLDEVSPEIGDALLLAAVRTVDPQRNLGALTPAREHAAQSLLPAMQRAMGRKQRRQIEEALVKLTPWDFRTFSIGLRRTEYRAAYAMSGDLLASLEYLRRYDTEIGRATDNPRVYLQHPVTSELIRYALSSEGFQERRRVGTVWALT